MNLMRSYSILRALIKQGILDCTKLQSELGLGVPLLPILLRLVGELGIQYSIQVLLEKFMLQDQTEANVTVNRRERNGTKRYYGIVELT